MAFGFTSIDALLDRKYDAQAKNANAAMLRAKAAMTRAQSNADLTDAQIDEIGRMAAGMVGQGPGQSAVGAGSIGLPSLNRLLGNQTQGAGAGGLAAPGGAVSGVGGLGAQASPNTVGSPSTGTQPAQTTGQQPRTTITAPQGFGLNRKSALGSADVFGSVFDETRGLR